MDGVVAPVPGEVIPKDIVGSRNERRGRVQNGVGLAPFLDVFRQLGEAQFI